MSNIVETAGRLAFLGAVEDACEALGDLSVRDATDMFKSLEELTTANLFRYHCQRILEENK